MFKLKNNKEYVRWETVNGYCKEFNFSQHVGKDDFIPESLFYLLGMKASNEKAVNFQTWLACEVIPQIRKEGTYIANVEMLNKIKEREENIRAHEERLLELEARLNEQVVKLEEAKKQYKFPHRTKLHFNKIIKSIAATKDEQDAIKSFVLASLAAETWEDLSVEDYPKIMELISIAGALISTKKFEHIKLF